MPVGPLSVTLGEVCIFQCSRNKYIWSNLYRKHTTLKTSAEVAFRVIERSRVVGY